MWKLFYNIAVVPVLWLMFHCMAMVNKKAARGLRGRRDLFERLGQKISALKPDCRRMWFHSSSMGEFEQAKPIIAELKKKYPDLQVIVSFFSPSGYEHSQMYKQADVITYIPFDSRKNARRFIQVINPAAAVFMRYDVWPNHLWELQRRGVESYIADATIREKRERALPVIRQVRFAIYNALDYILTVSSADEERFRRLSLSHPLITTMGDTRYDQVWQRSNDSKSRQLLPQAILDGRKVLVIGSSWEEDEHILFPACRRLHEMIPNLLIILVPHEPTAETLDRVEGELDTAVPHIRFSELVRYNGETVILIDSIGILMTLYRYAHVAYVGGGGGHGLRRDPGFRSGRDRAGRSGDARDARSPGAGCRGQSAGSDLGGLANARGAVPRRHRKAQSAGGGSGIGADAGTGRLRGNAAADGCQAARDYARGRWRDGG